MTVSHRTPSTVTARQTDETMRSANHMRFFLASAPSASPAAHAFDARRKKMRLTAKNAADATAGIKYKKNIRKSAMIFYLAVRESFMSTSSASSQSFSSLYAARFSSLNMCTITE